MSLWLSSGMVSANEYYYNAVLLKHDIAQSEKEDFSVLESLICKDDVEALKNSLILKKYGVNHAFGTQGNTLLHIAYSFNKPLTIEWLLNNGASERVCNSSGICPIQWSPTEYKDSRARVINELTKSCLERFRCSMNPDPDIVYDVILEFVRKNKWRYCDNESKNSLPFKDSIKVISLGLPSLIFHVNCVTLSELFVNVAKKIKLKAQVVYYSNYQSISHYEKDNREICGDFKMFDESQSAPFKFDLHAVAFSNGNYYDLSLMCKYKDQDIVLFKI